MAALETRVINLQWALQALREMQRRDNARSDSEFQRLIGDFIGRTQRAIATGKAGIRLELEEQLDSLAGVARIESSILLSSGGYFDFLRPHLSEITIEDVAHGLSHTCRFAGQCPVFYSVAQHCVHCSEVVPFQHAYAALMHDMSEAVLGDVTRPLKRLLPDYQALEARVEAALAARFNVPFPFPDEVKEADLAMLGAEQDEVMGCTDDWGNHLHAGIVITPWPAAIAKQRFLQRFKELTQ